MIISPSDLYHVLEAMAPLYAATALGYAAFRLRALTAEHCAGINHFAALFAIPFLIFRMVSSNDPYDMNLRFLAADALQKTAILAALAVWGLFRGGGGSAALPWVVRLFSLATLPMTVVMGPSVLGGMYGGAATKGLMVQIVVLQLVVWYVLVIVLLEYIAAKAASDGGGGACAVVQPVSDTESGSVSDHVESSAGGPQPPPSTKPSDHLVVAAKKILTNPVVCASLIGLVWSFIAFRLDIKMPNIIDNSLSMISDSANGLSMFSIGTFMARRKFISCSYSEAALAMFIRFAVGPAVMSASSLALGLHGLHLHVGIVQAALPLAVLSFVFSEKYNVHPEIMSTGVVVGILVSFPVTLLYYILLQL